MEQRNKNAWNNFILTSNGETCVIQHVQLHIYPESQLHCKHGEEAGSERISILATDAVLSLQACLSLSHRWDSLSAVLCGGFPRLPAHSLIKARLTTRNSPASLRLSPGGTAGGRSHLRGTICGWQARLRQLFTQHGSSGGHPQLFKAWHRITLCYITVI